MYADVIITRIPNETYEQHTPAGRYSWFDWDRNTLLDNGCFIGPQPMWCRSVHDLYGGFDDSYVTSGDYEFWLRISQTSNFKHINQPLGLYLAHPDSIEHRNEDTKQQENRRLLELYLQAAKAGRLVNFQPLQRLRNLQGTVSSEQGRAEATQVIRLIDSLLQKERSLPVEFCHRYAACRSAIIDGGDSSAQAFAEYQQVAERALLTSREWFVSRSVVYGGMKREEAAVRHKVRSEAMRQANLLAQRGDLDATVDVLISKGIRSAADDPAAYNALANLLVSANRFQDLLALLPEMPPVTDPALILEFQALSHAAAGDEAAAEAAARQAIALGGNRARSLTVLGTLAARQGNLPEAERLFRLAIQLDPSLGNGWLGFGMLLWGQGLHEEAFETLKRAVIVDPLNREAVQILRDMAERLNQQMDFLATLKSSLQIYPDCRHLALHAAVLSARTGLYNEAIAACEEFIVRFGADDEVLELALDLRRKIGVYDQLNQAGSESVSLCMIVKDEEACLARCLASVKPAVHELVVVDTGSSDRTVAIATAFGARASQFPWNGSFANARNHALEQARGNLILVLDADEVIANQDYSKIQQTISSGAGQKLAWSVLTRNYTTKVHAQGWTANDGSYQAEERVGGWHPSTKVRLFPATAEIRFLGEIHEMVEPALKAQGIEVIQADFVVHHYGELKDESGALQKKQHYYALGKEKLIRNPNNVTALIELGVQAGELGLYQEAIDYWDRVLAIDSTCVEAVFNKGFALMGLKRYTEALRLARETLRVVPSHKEAGFNYGTCALYAGDPAEALQRLDALAKQYPDYPPLLAISVVLNLAVNQLTHAKQCHAKLIAMQYAIDDYVAERAEVLRGQPNNELADVILENWRQVQAR
ncbi:MAG: glycosyltransferase [Geobacter sp.]